MKAQAKISMPGYTRQGYQSTHPVSRNQGDNKIRSMKAEAEGLRHVVTRSGSPAPGYQAQNVEANKRPARDGKISGMPPHQMDRYGMAENAKGKGSMRNMDDCYGQKPKMGGMPMHGRVKAAGTK